MNKTIKLIVAVLFLSLSCCKTESTDLAMKNLTGTKISTDSAYLRLYPKLLIGDTLISSTTSRNANYCVSVFRNDSLITLGTILPKGNGHGEYHSARFGADCKERLKIIDVIGSSSIMKRYEQSHIHEFLNPNPENDSSASTIPEMDPIRYVTNSFVCIGDSSILFNGSTYKSPDHLFSIADLRNGNVETLDFWPQDGYDGPSLPKQSVYTDNAVILKGDNKFLYKCGEERYAFIFSIEGNQIIVEKELFTELPDYEQASDGLNYNLRSRSIRRLECEATKRNIYALLVDKNNKGENATNWAESDSGNEVMVYDWNGNIKTKLIFDNVGTHIKVTDDDKILYLFSDNPNNGEKEVYSYPINQR